VDCADAYALSRWWQAVLDYREDPTIGTNRATRSAWSGHPTRVQR